MVNQTDVFEVFGAYFTNCYWNHLYDQALQIWSKEGYETLDEAYRTVINRYNMAFCRKAGVKEKINKHYTTIVKDLYKNYKEYLQVSDTYAGFVDSVVKILIPKNFYEKMSERDFRKDEIFRDVLTKTLTRFTMFVGQEGVAHAVTSALRKKTVALERMNQWKKKYIDLLCQERNNLCGLLLAKNSGVDIRNPEEVPSMPKQVCDKLSERIKQLIGEKNKMIVERNQYAKLAMAYKEVVRKQTTEIETLRRQLLTSTSRSRPRGSAPSPLPPPQPLPSPSEPQPIIDNAEETLEKIEEEYSDDEPVEETPTEFDLNEISDAPNFLADE
jgi:hypothetical protein